MLALYRAGRQSDALAAMQACRRHLALELGLEPGPELRQLEQRILRHDEALAPAVLARQFGPFGHEGAESLCPGQDPCRAAHKLSA